MRLENAGDFVRRREDKEGFEDAILNPFTLISQCIARHVEGNFDGGDMAEVGTIVDDKESTEQATFKATLVLSQDGGR